MIDKDILESLRAMKERTESLSRELDRISTLIRVADRCYKSWDGELYGIIRNHMRTLEEIFNDSPNVGFITTTKNKLTFINGIRTSDVCVERHNVYIFNIPMEDISPRSKEEAESVSEAIDSFMEYFNRVEKDVYGKVDWVIG